MFPTYKMEETKNCKAKQGVLSCYAFLIRFDYCMTSKLVSDSLPIHLLICALHLTMDISSFGA